MTRQDKATTELHARQLRELVKRPENKLCADCKRNDARWASWNIGAFICIRCSGIHRSMGTHISKVKSIDLDTWSTEQMKSIQRWGNHRVNLYWEARLRPGHNPPDHKMESFIRSKYESKRWAREGLVPEDPSALEEVSGGQTTDGDISSTISASEPSNTAATLPSAPRNTHRHQPPTLPSSGNGGRESSAQTLLATEKIDVQSPASQSASSASTQDDLFSLDFHAPTPSKSLTPKPTMQESTKHDILSLFSVSASTIPRAAPVTSLHQQQLAGPNQLGSAAPFSQTAQSQAQHQSTSMMGTSGTGLWGVQSGWTAINNHSNVIPPNIWGGTQVALSVQNSMPVQQGLFETQSIWDANALSRANGGPTGPQNVNCSTTTQASAKDDDVFGDLWN